jgi:hypothetical protein
MWLSTAPSKPPPRNSCSHFLVPNVGLFAPISSRRPFSTATPSHVIAVTSRMVLLELGNAAKCSLHLLASSHSILHMQVSSSTLSQNISSFNIFLGREIRPLVFSPRVLAPLLHQAFPGLKPTTVVKLVQNVVLGSLNPSQLLGLDQSLSRKTTLLHI